MIVDDGARPGNVTDAAVSVAFPFGKYKSVPLPNVPTSYLRWAAENLKLSAGLRHAVEVELGKRGVIVPPAPPRPPKRCPQCPGAPVLLYWYVVKGGRRTIRADCSRCNQWLGAAALTPENVAAADAYSTPGAFLHLLVRCEDAGIQVTRRGDRLEFEPVGKMTPELWRLERQARAQLVPQMIEEKTGAEGGVR